MKDIYNDQTYLRANPTWGAEDAPFKAAVLLGLLRKHSLSPATVAEVGCGSGEVLVQLSGQLPSDVTFTGYEVSADALSLAAPKSRPGLQFERLDVVSAGVGRAFDLVLVLDVLEHVENYFSLLNAIASMGKWTIFHIPLDLSVWSLFQEKMLLESKARVGHIHSFTEAFILDVLRDHGFRVVEKIYTEPSFLSTTPKQRLVNVVRKGLFAINRRFATKFIGGYSVMVLCENRTFATT